MICIRDIHTAVTMDPAAPVLHDVDILVEDGRITRIGPGLAAGCTGRIIDGRWCVAYPGFINTHHHLFQNLTRNLPLVQNAKLFDWLTNLYAIWRNLTPEAIEVSARVALGELLLSGCTTTSDHLYLFPAATDRELIDVEIGVAREMGVRFHPTRGSMCRGQSEGGLPPDDVVQSPDAILEDCERLVSAYHDPAPFSMCRIVMAPCSPFSVTTDLMQRSAAFARERGLHLHTHLCETVDEETYCREVYGMRPLEYMEQTGWVGPDVWYAHGIYFNDAEIERLAATGTSIAHCPGSNLRLGSGICKVPQLLEKGVCVGLAVDGSSSNDASSMVREMQLALLVHRIGTGVDAMPPQNVLAMATIHGARLLGRDDIGMLRQNMAADLVLFRLDRIDFAGALHDPGSALLFCGAGQRAEWTMVNGRILVEKGHLCDLDEAELFHRANVLAAELVAGASRP